MKYCTATTADKGKPIRVYDATGAEVHYCVSCDTETGDVEVYALDTLGRVLVDHTIQEPTVIAKKLPAPLRVEWCS